jgi:hypothetical protein
VRLPAVRTPGLLSPRAAWAPRVGAACRLTSPLSRALLTVLVMAPAASGQVTPDSLRADPLRADTLRADSLEAIPDSLAQPVDSARLAILRRLERLARPVGADSVLFVQDSLRREQASEGVRPGMSIAGDSVASALMRMPGFSMTQYEGASADFEAQRRVLVLQAPAEGRARVNQEGILIEADSSITFDEASGSMRTVGMATFTPSDGDPVDAANMIYDIEQGRGSAVGAETSWTQDGAQWIVRGDMPYAAQDSTFMAHAAFTSCDLTEPHYHFETDEIKIVAGNVLVARGVRLYFADVPVAWLPFLAQSLERGRRSGILTPRFSVNDIVSTSSGYRRRVSNLGFYWAASDHADALVAMDWFSETFFAVTSSMRYTFRRQFLDGDLAVRRYWNSDGSRELALDTRHSWDMDERTQLRISGRFVSNNDFVRENSFNPTEVTQSIDSEAGLNRRFSWGSVSTSANRRQYLSDDRTEWLLPSVNVSLSPITLFRAPSSEAAFYNNMTWSGSGGLRRNTVERLQPDTFALATANTSNDAGSLRSNLSVGNLTFSQSAELSQRTLLDVPEALLLLGDSADASMLVSGMPVRDVSDATLGWNLGLNYQQQLIGSTTVTPRLSVAGSFFRSDQDSLAQSFVAAPRRVSFGAQLKTDVYGFFPGFGPFEAVRHKFSPSFDYQWSPETTPTALQREIFNSRALQPQNVISLSLTQTWEAKRRSDEEDDEQGPDAGDGAAGDLPAADSLATAADRTGLQPGSRDPFAAGRPGGTGPESDGPQRVQQNPSVTLLAWRSSVIQYDFVQADSAGSKLAGFETTRLSNQFSSDYLRGLSVSMDHELWIDDVGTGGMIARRRFDPHLSSVNFGFSLGSSSAIVRLLSFLGGGDDGEVVEEPDSLTIDDFQGDMDESMIVPVAGREAMVPAGGGRRGEAGGWSANLSYSLQRPRDPTRPASQMVSGTLRLQPTVNWGLSWRTAFDLEVNAFNDHSIRLTRDLHRWQANFDFLQTATGNWTFRFEVSLLDNRDLKFDYRQRNLDLGLPSSRR